MTLVSHIDSKKALVTSDVEMVNSVMRTLEVMIRGNDQLDEQLHAGFFFYILTTTSSFVSNDQFIWGFTLAIIGVAIPVVLAGASHQERL